MATRAEFIARVEAFLRAQKTLAGIDMPMQWTPGRDNAERSLRIPIEIDGIQSGQFLSVTSKPFYHTLAFSIALVDGVGVCRLDFDETTAHPNPLAHLDRITPMANGSHYHGWAINVRFIESDGTLPKLRHAIEIPDTIRTFQQSLRWFCDENIIALPHDHQIELPIRGLL